MIPRLISGFCVATVLTQLLLVAVLSGMGNLNYDTTTKIIGLLNGIDISGDRLEQIITQVDQREIPSFEEVLERRAIEGLDMELRLRSQANYYQQLQAMMTRLQTDQERFDRRREAFNRRLEELEEGSREAGMQELQRTLQVLPNQQAKNQLLKMFDDGDLEVVMNIVQALPVDKRKKILAEFNTPDEADKLHQILQRLGEGEPKASLIDQARQER